MTTYNIVRRADGERITSYTSPSVITDGPYPLAEFDHVAVQSGAPAVSTAKFGGKRRLTHLEFRSLFTGGEIRAIDNFQAKFDSYAWLTEGQKDVIRTDIKEFGLATYVDIDDPKYRPGLTMYVQLGILEAHRVDEVLNG